SPQVDLHQLLLNQLPKFIASLDGLDLLDVERAAHDEPHLAGVGDESLDAASREGQGVRREVPCHPVILDRTRECRDVEETNEVAVLVTVAGLPRMGREQGDVVGFHDQPSSSSLPSSPPSGVTMESSCCLAGSGTCSANASLRSFSRASKSLEAAARWA